MLKDWGSKKGETCVKWRGRCNARAVMTSPPAHNNIAGALIMSHSYLVIHFRHCRVVLLSKLLSIITPYQYIAITVTTTLMIFKSNNLPYIEGVGVLSIYHIYCWTLYLSMFNFTTAVLSPFPLSCLITLQ